MSHLRYICFILLLFCIWILIPSGCFERHDSLEFAEDLVYKIPIEFRQNHDINAFQHPLLEGLHPEEESVSDLDSIYKSVGDYFFDKNDGEASMFFYVKRKEICIQQFGSSSLEVARCYADIGKVFRYRLSRYHEAKEVLHQGLKLAKANGDSTSRALFDNYYWLASSYNRIGDFSNARIYALAAYDLAEKLPKPNIDERSKGLLILGTIHGNLHRRKDAISYLSRLIPLEDSIKFDSRGSDYLYNNLGANYVELWDMENGKKTLTKSYSINKKGKGASAFRLTLKNLAAMYYMNENLDSSLYFYNEALLLNRRAFPKDRLQLAHFNRAIGGVYFKMGQLDSALVFYQNALQIGFENFNEEDISKNPLITKSDRNHELFILLSGKGEALLKKFYEDHFEIKWLTMALDCYQKADSVIMMNRAGFDHEASKLNMASVNYRQVYADAIECVYLLDSLGPDPKYRELAFRFMEKNKSMILFEAISKNSLSKRAGIDPALREKELNLIEAVSYNEQAKRLLQNKIDNISSQPKNLQELSPLLQKRDSLNKISISLDQKGELLKRKIRKNSPKYADQKYGQEFLELDQICKLLLKPGQAILEYFITDSVVYVLCIQDEVSSLSKLHLDNEFLTSINEYKQSLLQSSGFRVEDSTQFNEYTEKALFLYRKLVATPLGEKNQQINSLIIIPDAILSDLPFESLLVSMPVSSKLDYRKLDYLFQSVNVSYALSANVLVKNKESSKAKKIKPKVLGFSYLNNEKLGALPGSLKEIQSLQSTFSGTYFTGEKATIENFRSNVEDKDLIHLAIHGNADTSDNYASCLHFVPDEIHDGKLYAYDLYNLKLDASLIVLSACESGIGAKAQGEGTYSIARGFAFGGCPTQVITLWSINDQASVDLMQAFYNQLGKGTPTGEALSIAKKKLVKQYDEYMAHPSNWAAFIVLGDSETAFKK